MEQWDGGVGGGRGGDLCDDLSRSLPSTKIIRLVRRVPRLLARGVSVCRESRWRTTAEESAPCAKASLPTGKPAQNVCTGGGGSSERRESNWRNCFIEMTDGRRV